MKADLSSLPPEKVPYNSAMRAEGRIVGPKWPIAIVAMLAALIAILDVSIVNVALPSIRASVGASLQDTSWISTGYIVSNIVIIPMTGFFQRRIGYGRYFAGSMLLFTVASMLCATSWNLWSLVFFRMLQGLGGGALIPTASSIMLDRFPRNERTMAMATFGLGAMMGPLLGPSLGGWLTDQFSWHMIFLINVPFGILEIFLVMTILREDRSGVVQEPTDWPGIGFLVSWLATMQYVLEEGNADGWLDDPVILGLSLVSFASFLLFVDRELSTPHPLVKLRFFADRQYTMGTLINMGLGISMFGGIYLFSLYCGVILGYRASDTGNVIFWAALVQGMTMPIIGRFGGRWDPRLMVFFGVSMLALSLYQYTSFTGLEGRADLMFPQVLRALGMSFIFIPVSTLSLDNIEARDAGDATGLFNLTRELGGSIGTAMLATAITRRTALHAGAIAATMSDPVAQQRLAGTRAAMTAAFGDPDRAAQAAFASLQGTLMKQSLILAFDDSFAITTAVAVGMLVVVALMKKPTQTRAIAVGH